jgi:putative redox protein
MHFEGKAGFDHEIPIDFPPPLGDGAGLRGLELLLMSMAACSGQTTISLLQKMKQDVRGFKVTASGTSRDEHPQVLTEIYLEYIIDGENLDRALVEKAIRLSEEKYCPVWAMLKPGVKMSSTISMNPAAPEK